MTETKFTPGPWKWGVTDDLGGQMVLPIAQEQDGFWHAVCRLRDTDDTAFYAILEEADANARLIAAAPDMYAALVAVNRCGNAGAKLSRAASDMTRRALAKAVKP